MKNTRQTYPYNENEQEYTEDDSRHFERLMQSTHRGNSLIQNAATSRKHENNFEYSDDDSRLFEHLSVPLTRFRRHGRATGKASRSGNYTQDDQKLFESLAPEVIQSENPNAVKEEDSVGVSRAQQYSESDLSQFRTLLTGQPREEVTEEQRDGLAPSPRDLDVGKMKIKQFDQHRFGSDSNEATHTDSEKSKIKVKYFD